MQNAVNLLKLLYKNTRLVSRLHAYVLSMSDEKSYEFCLALIVLLGMKFVMQE